jgi:hypothetical protein
MVPVEAVLILVSFIVGLVLGVVLNRPTYVR